MVQALISTHKHSIQPTRPTKHQLPVCQTLAPSEGNHYSATDNNLQSTMYIPPILPRLIAALSVLQVYTVHRSNAPLLHNLSSEYRIQTGLPCCPHLHHKYCTPPLHCRVYRYRDKAAKTLLHFTLHSLHKFTRATRYEVRHPWT